MVTRKNIESRESVYVVECDQNLFARNFVGK